MSSAGFALDEIQKAVYTALSSDAGLTSTLTGSGRIYDYVPEKAKFPYVTIGDNTAKDWSTQTFEGMESTLTLHAWGIEHGRLGVQSIMKQIYRILHNGALPMTTQRSVLMRQEFATVSLDPDGTTYHGVQRFRVLTQGV